MNSTYTVSMIAGDGLMRTGLKMTVNEEAVIFSFMGKVIKEKKLDSISGAALSNVDWQVGKWIFIYFSDELIKINASGLSKRKIYDFLNSKVHK